jgi:RNA polymerase sigma-70 factor (ECF subfamily)
LALKLVAIGSKKLKNLDLPTLPSGYIMNAPMGKEKQKNQLEEVFVKYKSIVTFRVKKSLGAYNPDCDDVANEIITNVIEKIKKGQFRGESSVGTFIYTITSRRIIDYIRQKSKVLKHVPEPASYPDPQEQIEDKERAEMIATAIKKLKPKYREVLYLYYYEEFSREEVAQKLGISPRRVSERVNYSQKLLKKLLKT